MERIKLALERARKERLGGGPGNPAGPLPFSAARPRAVAYNRTRTVAVAPERMRLHRVVTDPEHACSDAYRVLRTRVLRQLREHGWNTLAITSAGEGEGKTLSAVNLALSLAVDANQTVLLVDADLRRPAVHRCFGLAPERGLADYLRGEAEIEDVLLHPDIERLVLLPGSASAAESTEMLASPRMAQLMAELKSRYADRVVIFDLPPILGGADVLAFAPGIDATLLVVEEGKTSSEDATHAAELLSGIRLIGTVLNKARSSFNAGRGYGMDAG